jgi:hypothetical protein
VEVHAPGEDEARRLMSCSTDFTRKDTQRRRCVTTSWSCVARNRNAGAISCIADSHFECNFRAEVLGPRNAIESSAFPDPHADRVSRTNLKVYVK